MSSRVSPFSNHGNPGVARLCLCVNKFLVSDLRLFERNCFQCVQAFCALILGLGQRLCGLKPSVIGESYLIGSTSLMDIMAVHPCEHLPLMHVVSEIGVDLLDSAIRQHAQSPRRIVGQRDAAGQTQHAGRIALFGCLDFDTLRSLLAGRDHNFSRGTLRPVLFRARLICGLATAA